MVKNFKLGIYMRVGRVLPKMLSESVLKAFYPTKLFTEHSAPINAIDFCDSGEFLVASSDDESFSMYDCVAGKKVNSFNSKKYGCTHTIFTHSNNCIVHASNKVDNTLRYLSLHDFRYIRYFTGHSGPISDMQIAPDSDIYVSVSTEDRTARIWDLRSSHCQGLTQPNSPPTLIRMDPKGLIFATATLRKTILLYDLRSFDKGHFYEFSIPISSNYGPPEPIHIDTSSIADFEFSPDGQRVVTLVANELEVVLSILDSYEGRVFNCISTAPPWAYLNTIKNPDVCCRKMRLNVTTTPDSNYFLTFIPSKMYELYLQAWRLDTGQQVSLYDPCVNKTTCRINHVVEPPPYHISMCKFNPRYMMMATTCDRSLIMWQPDQDKTF